MHSLRAAVTITILLLLVSPVARAGNLPGDVHFSTYMGQYAPQSDVVNELEGNVEARMANALGYGGQLTVWLNSAVALAASGFYVSTTLDGDAFGVTGSLDASVFMGGARVVLGLGGTETGPSLVNLSAGIVANSTDYGPAVESGTHAAGVVGVDLNVPLGRNAGLRLGVDDYIHDKWFEVGDVSTEAARQHDVVLYGGLTLYPGR